MGVLKVMHIVELEAIRFQWEIGSVKNLARCNLYDILFPNHSIFPFPEKLSKTELKAIG